MIRALLVPMVLLCGCVTTVSEPLDRLHPYLWVSQGRAEWFTCRWTTHQPVGYAILGTDEDETRVVRTALAAWQAAGLGVRFSEVPADAAQLLLTAVEGPVDRDDGSRGAGRTIADCALGEGAQPSARVVSARVEVSRAVGPDALGKMHPLGPNEWLGTWVHEIGHALGFQGHLRRGDDPMRLEPDFQRLVGERLRNGKALHSPALHALYQRASGSPIGSLELPAGRSDDLDEIARLARAAGLAGPLLRSGDRAARIFWRDARGKEYGFVVLDYPAVLKRPDRLVLLAEPTTRRELR